MERAMAFKQSHLPNRIYKYRADNSNALNNLTNDTVRMSSPDKYNDPYDCAFKIVADDIFKALSSTLLKEFLKNYGLDDPDGEEAIKQAEASDDPFGFPMSHIAAKLSAKPEYHPTTITVFDQALVRAQIEDAIAYLNQVRATTKICSFCETNDNLLMWSHYAVDHKGFCLETILRRSGPITQCAKPLPGDLFAGSLRHDAVRAWLGGPGEEKLQSVPAAAWLSV